MNVEDWLKKGGRIALNHFGLRKGHKVLDFGSGSGMYTIVASKVVGQEGEVISVDKEEDKISKLKEKLKEQSITNVRILKTEGDVNLPFQTATFNMVLLYDVLHLIDNNERYALIQEFHRILKKNGILSFYATHLEDLDMNFDSFDLKLSRMGFTKRSNLKEVMFHYNWIEEGIVANYFKNQ